LKVKELMSAPAITVSSRNSIQEALEIMRDSNIRRLPVVEGRQLVGILVQHDIEKGLRRPGVICEAPVEWVMTPAPVHTVSPDHDVVEAATVMKERKISVLPVVEGGRLVGIITDTDILGLFIKTFHQHWS
jgi:CBS domain-containing protein